MYKWQLCKFVLYKLGYNPGEMRKVTQVHCTVLNVIKYSFLIDGRLITVTVVFQVNTRLLKMFFYLPKCLK